MFDISPTDARLVALDNETASLAILMTISYIDSNGDTQSWNITEAGFDVTVGSTVYEPGDIKSMSPLRKDSGVSRDIWGGTFAGKTWFERLKDNFTGATVSLLLAVLDADGLVIGQPFSLYKGVGASCAFEAQGSQTVTSIEFTGPFARIDNKFERVTTDENQRRVDATDNAFQYVHVVQNVQTWGQK